MANPPSETDSEQMSTDSEAAAQLEEAVGMPIPDEHVGAFVAEVFEDAERSTEWEEVVDSMVAPSAREDWNSLDTVEQVSEVLAMADCYDRQAADALAAIEITGEEPEPETRAEFEEAMRLRRNADAFRDGVADAYAKGHVGDDQLVDAVEGSDFDTDAIARREDELERLTSAYDFDYRPYGGTLMQESESQAADPEIPETF